MSLNGAYIIKHDKDSRHKNDYYPTAPIATYSLVKNYDLPKRLLEPAAGRGWISRELQENGFDVISKDLYEYNNLLVPVQVGEDFLTSTKDLYVEGMITNPPFKSGMPLKFVKHSLKLYNFTCIFSRLTFLEGIKRGKFFKENPFTKLIVLSSRVNCDENLFYKTRQQSGGMVAYGWFIWDANDDIKNQITFVDPKDYMEEFVNIRGEKYLDL